MVTNKTCDPSKRRCSLNLSSFPVIKRKITDYPAVLRFETLLNVRLKKEKVTRLKLSKIGGNLGKIRRRRVYLVDCAISMRKYRVGNFKGQPVRCEITDIQARCIRGKFNDSGSNSGKLEAISQSELHP